MNQRMIVGTYMYCKSNQRAAASSVPPDIIRPQNMEVDYVLIHNICTYGQWHEISNNVVCATSNGSDQLAHMRSLIRAFVSRLNIV